MTGPLPSADGPRRTRFPLASLAWRESRTTRRRLLLYMSSISLGVAALVGIDSFAENFTSSVREQSLTLIGGDLTFGSRQKWPAPIDSTFAAMTRAGHPVAKVTTFASMALAHPSGGTRLAQVRAVSDRYPLYGAVLTAPRGHWDSLFRGRTAIVDPNLLTTLNARVGDSISLGQTTFAIVAAAEHVPGDPEVETAVAPPVFIHDVYADSTGLLQLGSRADYDAFARVTSGSPNELLTVLRPRLDSFQIRARTADSTETLITGNIRELGDFLGIVGVIALLLGGIGVASGVYAWVRRKIDTVAVLRCLGASSRQVLLIYASQAALMGLVGAVIGGALGLAIQLALPRVARDFLPVDVVVRPVPMAIIMGLALGIWIALAFALRPLLALRRVSPLQALRREFTPVRTGAWWRDVPRVVVNLLLFLSVVGVAATRSQSLDQVFGFTAGILVALGALALSAALLARLAKRLVRGTAGSALPYVARQGIANLYRPANQTRSVVLSLGFGAFLMTTLFLVQSNLLRQLDIVEEASRANLILFDVQDDQLAGVDSIARARGEEIVEKVPIVTMRVSAINGVDAEKLREDTTRQSWTIRREYRSTYRGDLTGTETVVAGTWHGNAVPPAGTKLYEVSLDRELAEGMRVSVGDTITWNVQGAKIDTRLTSLREINWARFETNFFAVFQPGSLDQAPKMHAVLVHTPTEERTQLLQRDIVRRYANVASIDLTLIRRTIKDIADKATLAIRFLALFSLGMGIPVLFSAVAATRRERVRDAVLLKVLGATKRQIGRILLAEYVALGVLGSLAGMVLAFAGAALIMRFVFERSFDPTLSPVLAIGAAMVALTVSIGLISGRDVFHETPMTALRAEG